MLLPALYMQATMLSNKNNSLLRYDRVSCFHWTMWLLACKGRVTQHSVYVWPKTAKQLKAQKQDIICDPSIKDK